AAFRRDALLVLGSIGDSDERVAPALLKALQHKEKEVRVLAAVNLGQMGPKYAKETMPALLEGLDVRGLDQSPGGQAESRLDMVARALAKMGALAKDAAPKLRAILNERRSDPVLEAVERALKEIEP